MRKALREYWPLIAMVMVVSVVAVGLYAMRFHTSYLSGDTDDWANFATYISGTVGVAVVTATLLALINTLVQQGRLIGQQDKIIEQQQHQLDSSDAHQRRIEAYSRAEKFFPALLRSCQEDMDVNVTQRLEERGWPCSRSEYVSPRMVFQDFFDEKLIPPGLENSGNIYFSSFWGEFLQKPYSLAVLVAGCLEDAEELRSYFNSELGRYQGVMACALIYIYPLYTEEVERVSRVLELPLDYSGMGMPQTKWQEAGLEAFSKRVG